MILLFYFSRNLHPTLWNNRFRFNIFKGEITMKKNVFELTEEFVAEEKELMELCMKQFDITDLVDAGFDEIKLVIKTVKMMEMANNLIVEQARLLVAMDEKLNRLLEEK